MQQTAQRFPPFESEVPRTRLPSLGVAGPRIGLDLVGIGDFFGPIVVAGAIVTEDEARRLREAGVWRPSKWTDRNVFRGVSEVRKVLPRGRHGYVVISPRRYNELLISMAGRKRIIAWAHARCIERLSEGGPACRAAVAGDFGDREFVEERLYARGLGVVLIEVPNAEREVAVAAASFVAHAALLRARKRMNEKYGVTFPSGASKVVEFGRRLVAEFGQEVLLETGKTDFRTVAEIID